MKSFTSQLLLLLVGYIFSSATPSGEQESYNYYRKFDVNIKETDTISKEDCPFVKLLSQITLIQQKDGTDTFEIYCNLDDFVKNIPSQEGSKKDSISICNKCRGQIPLFRIIFDMAYACEMNYLQSLKKLKCIGDDGKEYFRDDCKTFTNEMNEGVFIREGKYMENQVNWKENSPTLLVGILNSDLGLVDVDEVKVNVINDSCSDYFPIKKSIANLIDPGCSRTKREWFVTKSSFNGNRAPAVVVENPFTIAVFYKANEELYNKAKAHAEKNYGMSLNAPVTSRKSTNKVTKFITFTNVMIFAVIVLVTDIGLAMYIFRKKE